MILIFRKYFFCVFLSLYVCNGEYESHIEEDHKAFLGSRKKEFDDLSIEEAKRRLRLLVPHIDVNKDGLVSFEELEVWVKEKYESLLDPVNAGALFRETDTDFDERVSWSEYMWRHFGIRYNGTDEHTNELKNQFAGYILRDVTRWKYADENKDNFLEEREFHMFIKPKYFKEMLDVVVQEEIHEIDHNGDGFISLEEYLDSLHMPAMKALDTKRFEEYDEDKDGKLNFAEVKIWKTPELFDRSKLEAKHLIEIADDNKDGKLSSSEIVLHHFIFAGSKATQSGAILRDEF